MTLHEISSAPADVDATTTFSFQSGSSNLYDRPWLSMYYNSFPYIKPCHDISYQAFKYKVLVPEPTDPQVGSNSPQHHQITHQQSRSIDASKQVLHTDRVELPIQLTESRLVHLMEPSLAQLLPLEVLLYLFRKLIPSDVARCTQVCRSWRVAGADPALWRFLCWKHVWMQQNYHILHEELDEDLHLTYHTQPQPQPQPHPQPQDQDQNQASLNNHEQQQNRNSFPPSYNQYNDRMLSQRRKKDQLLNWARRSGFENYSIGEILHLKALENILFQKNYCSWRRMFLKRPHLRYDGLYVFNRHFVRASSTSKVALISYFRIFRFFPHMSTAEKFYQEDQTYRTETRHVWCITTPHRPEVLTKVLGWNAYQDPNHIDANVDNLNTKNKRSNYKAESSIFKGTWSLDESKKRLSVDYPMKLPKYPNMIPNHVFWEFSLDQTHDGAWNRLFALEHFSISGSDDQQSELPVYYETEGALNRPFKFLPFSSIDICSESYFPDEKKAVMDNLPLDEWKKKMLDDESKGKPINDYQFEYINGQWKMTSNAASSIPQ